MSTKRQIYEAAKALTIETVVRLREYPPCEPEPFYSMWISALVRFHIFKEKDIAHMLAGLSARVNNLENALFDMVIAHCSIEDGMVDAMGTTEHAEAIELLAEYGRLEIIDGHRTRMVRARIVKKA